MMDDKLKSFINENRNSFDSEKAPSNAWAKVENNLGSSPKKGSISLKNMWLILGGTLLLFAVLSVAGNKYMSVDDSQQYQYAEIKDDDFQSMQKHYQPLLQSTEQKFVSEVNAPSVMDELTELDEGFAELQNDYLGNDAVNKEMMLRLMKENYELRIKILEMAMKRINEKAVPTTLNKEKRNEY
jgi:hypothetical protein